MLSTIASTIAGATTLHPPTAGSSSAEESPGSVSSTSRESTPRPREGSNTVMQCREEATQTSGHASAAPPNTAPVHAPAPIVDNERKAPKEGIEYHYLRRAEPKDLPGHPTSGLASPLSAGAAAASMAHTNSKPSIAWKPNPTSAAGAAASLAHASREAGGWGASPQPTSSRPGASFDRSKDDWGLRGAVGAMGKNRQQSGTSPVGLDSGSIKRDSGFVSGPGDGAAAKHQRASIISAASLSMTNDRQKRETKSPPRAAVHPLTRRAKNPNLEEAARQHAEERLSKLGYGRERPSTTRLRSMSVNSVRLRADQIDREARMRDDEESERSAQRKRGYDALLLMSTARKNVQSRLSEQDRQMADSRGIYYREDWHQKATEIAQSKHDQREAPPEGVDIGGGAFMSQEEINAIAERKVKPVIDDMNEKSGEYHQSRKDRREAKARELATKLNRDKEKRFLGRKRRSGAPEAESPTVETVPTVESGDEVVREAVTSPATASDIQSPAIQPQLGEGVGDESSKVYAMPNEVPKGKKTLLGKLVGRNRGSRSELREAFTPLGMVRSDMVRSDLVPRPAHPNLQHAGEAAEPAPVSRSNTAATFDSTPEKPSWLSRLGRKISRRGKLSREFSNSSPVQTVEHSPASPTNEHSHRSNRGSIGGLMDLIRGGNRNSSLEHASEQHARVAEAVDVRSEPRAQVPAGIHVGRGRAAEEAPGATEAPPVVLGTATVPDGQIDPAEIETEADLDTTALIIMPKSASRGAASSLPDPKCELRLTANAINPNGPVNATPPAAVTQTSNTVTKTSFFPASNIISPTATHDPIIKTEVLEASAAPADQERFVISDGDSDDIIHPDDIIGTTTKTEKAVVEELRVLPVGSEAPIEASTTTTPVILNSGIGTFDPLPAVNKGPAEAAAVKNIPAAKEKALEAAKPGMVDLYMPLGGEEEESEARVRMDTEYHMPSVKEEEEPVAIRAGMVSEAEQVHAEVLKDLSSNVTVARGSKFHEDL